MDDADEVERVAGEFLERHGPSVILELRERAEIAAANEDQLSAEAWTDIADAVDRLLWGRCLCPRRAAPKILALALENVLHWGRIEGERVHVVNLYEAVADGQDSVFTQPFERAVHMHEGEPEMVAYLLLRHRQGKLVTVSNSRLYQPSAKIEHQRGNSLDRAAAAERNNPVVKPPLVLGELPHEAQRHVGIGSRQLECGLVA